MVLDPGMPRAKEKIICPKCGYDEAVYYLKTDKDEKKITLVYICASIDSSK